MNPLVSAGPPGEFEEDSVPDDGTATTDRECGARPVSKDAAM